MEQREGELVYLKLDMDGADGKALSSQGILAGTEYEYYKPFDDAPEYEEYKEVPTWLKVVAGVAVAAVVGLAAAALGVTAVQLGMTAGVLTAGAGIAAVAATVASDKKNGTESSLGDYISNAFSVSARVGASCIAITLGMYGAEVMTLTVSGGMGLIPVGGTVVTLPQLAGAFQLVTGTVTSQNLLFQMEEVRMFCASGKEMGAPTGNWMHDSARELMEMASMQFAVYGLMNPYTYQRPKITPLPNETALTVPGGTGVAVVPNGTAPAVKPSYLPVQYSEYPAAVQGWAQQALPGGGSSIGGGTSSKIGYEYLDDQLGNLKDKVKINQYQSAESVNAWWEARGYKSPYKEKTVVQNITLTEDTKFVRVYDGVNSNLEGGWVMRAEDIKGLTPKEIQAKFALEYEPKFIGEVELKAGDTVRLGEVGSNFGFDGGGIQIDLQQQWIGDFTELGKIADWR